MMNKGQRNKGKNRLTYLALLIALLSMMIVIQGHAAGRRGGSDPWDSTVWATGGAATAYGLAG